MLLMKYCEEKYEKIIFIQVTKSYQRGEQDQSKNRESSMTLRLKKLITCRSVLGEKKRKKKCSQQLEESD